jgi:hypothetical protein
MFANGFGGASCFLYRELKGSVDNQQEKHKCGLEATSKGFGLD